MDSGIPPGGAADLCAFHLNNAVLGNAPNRPALELMLLGGALEVLAETFLAFTGADLAPRINGEPIPLATPVRAHPGDLLETSAARSGCFAYLGISGGFDAATSLGSHSTYIEGGIGGHEGRALVAGDVLVGSSPAFTPEAGTAAPVENEELSAPPTELRFTRGPQTEYFGSRGYASFTARAYRVSAKSSRMGYRLEGPVPEIESVSRTANTGSGPTDVIEEGNAVGSIQIAGGTEVICLGRDCGTSGAYAKIGCIIGADVSRMAQLAPGSQFHFVEVSRDDAREAREIQDRILARVSRRSRELTALNAGLAAA
jgi:biotin-dependent carboxylase-like uncharacterized protein